LPLLFASVASAAFVSKMVKRTDKLEKYTRWRIYFARSSQVRSWIITLHEIVLAGRANINFLSVSKYVVELVWQHPVTCSSPTRLVKIATDKNASIETIGDPIGIADDVYVAADEVAQAAPTGVADDARGAPDEAAAAALDEPAAPETKRRRIFGKRASVVSPTSASHEAPRADDAEAASATGPAIAYHAEIEAPPADDAQPASRRRWKSTPTLAEAASAAEVLPSSLLFLNWDHRFDEEYEVAWGSPLGRGKFGTVYKGAARGVVNQAVAIKLLKYGTRSERAKNADAEVRRYVTLPSHPHIVKLMDVLFFGGRVGHLRLAWSSSASTETSGSS
jgi:hypothetical protein